MGAWTSEGQLTYQRDFALNMPDMQLKPGESYSLEWYIFAHEGNDDFAINF